MNKINENKVERTYPSSSFYHYLFLYSHLQFIQSSKKLTAGEILKKLDKIWLELTQEEVDEIDRIFSDRKISQALV